MGSRFTENREKMAVVLESLKKRDLFFLDSLTTAHSVVPSLAEDLGVKYLQRNIFLDNEVAEEPIRQQLEKLIQVAQAQVLRWVVAILIHCYYRFFENGFLT